MSDSIYNNIILSKTESEIPVLKNGRTIESKYNPEREAAQLIQGFNRNTLFFIITGIGSGILIKTISENFPESKIIALEKTKADIDFLAKLKVIKELSKNPNIIFTEISELEDSIIQNYAPALHGNLQIFENKAWITENPEEKESIQLHIQRAIKKVSADFSVQAHFGKIWQQNILTNLKIYSEKPVTNCQKKINLNKTAAIIAAGPSLDSYIEELKKADYYIIATDTAFSILKKYSITVNAVVSLDGQYVSYNHFLGELKDNCKSDFYFDLSSNPTAAKKVLDNKKSLNYFISGHPLSQYAVTSQGLNLLKLYSGSGTVTITAFDLALQLGFTKFKIFGADFSYTKKAYAKGSYLDSLYQLSSNRINTVEKQFSKLMFRTELIKKGEYISTQVLESYKSSFEEYLMSSGCNFTKNNMVYEITLAEAAKERTSSNKSEVLGKAFYKNFINQLKNDKKNEIILLPYIAWLRKNLKFSDNTYKELVMLARKSLERYN